MTGTPTWVNALVIFASLCVYAMFVDKQFDKLRREFDAKLDALKADLIERRERERDEAFLWEKDNELRKGGMSNDEAWAEAKRWVDVRRSLRGQPPFDQ
jgi:hypothetical protein